MDQSPSIVLASELPLLSTVIDLINAVTLCQSCNLFFSSYPLTRVINEISLLLMQIHFLLVKEVEKEIQSL